MVSVEDKTAATLIPIIKRYILPGTKVMSDCWKSYERLEEGGYIHGTVNHSLEFVNSEAGDHTKNIESTWRAVKRLLPRSGTVKHHYNSFLQSSCLDGSILKTVMICFWLSWRKPKRCISQLFNSGLF